MTELEFRNAKSETEKYRELTAKYCYRSDGLPGCGVDIASQGAPVVTWAMGFDLPPKEFSDYCGGHPAKGEIQLRGFAEALPFDDGSLDFVYSSHLLEDYFDWTPILREWVRVLKPGGKLIVLIPDVSLWAAAIRRGQTPNCSHRHEGTVGELSFYAEKLKLRVIEDRLTAIVPEDYTILFAAEKL